MCPNIRCDVFGCKNLHYRKTHKYRVSTSLPSARPRALGKYVAHSMPTLCRMLAVGKERHSAYPHFAECQKASTRQRQVTCTARVPTVRRPSGCLTAVILCRVLKRWHSAKRKLRRVSMAGTRQSLFRQVTSSWHSANSFYFYFFCSIFFIINSNLKS